MAAFMNDSESIASFHDQPPQPESFMEALQRVREAHDREMGYAIRESRRISFGKTNSVSVVPSFTTLSNPNLKTLRRGGSMQKSNSNIGEDDTASGLNGMYSVVSDVSVAAEGTTDDAVARWGLLVHHLRTGRVTAPTRSFKLLPHWTLMSGQQDMRNSIGFASAAAFRRAAQGNTAASTRERFVSGIGDLPNGDLPRDWRYQLFRDWIVNPGSPIRVTWTILGVFLLMWDTLTIPLQVFDFGSFYSLFRTITMTVTIYWAMDIPLSLILGYYTAEGLLELRLHKTIKRYMRTWFWPDFTVLILDFICFFVLESDWFEGSQQKGAMSVRLARLMRMMRFVRLIRVRRLGEIFACMVDRLGSQHVLLAVSLGRYCSLILIINHYVACAWYGITMWVADEGTPTWITTAGLESEGYWYQYITALHWSLTQFAPSTQNIAPTNVGERTFAAVTSLTAMLVFSSFISGVTNAVNQIRVVNMEPLLEQAKIRDFMMTRGISTELFARVQTFFKRNYTQRSKRVREEDVEFFQSLPKILLIEMHLEIYYPKLFSWSVVRYFSDVDDAFFKRLCHEAIVESSFVTGQDVFIDGTRSQGMYLAVNGKPLYDHVQNNVSGVSGFSLESIDEAALETLPTTWCRRRVPLDTWFSELSTWVQWVHMGRLTTDAPTDFLQVSTNKVAPAVLEHASPLLFGCLRVLAILIVAHAEEMESQDLPLTDLPLDPYEMTDLADRAHKFNNLRLYGAKDKSKGGTELQSLASGMKGQAFSNKYKKNRGSTFSSSSPIAIQHENGERSSQLSRGPQSNATGSTSPRSLLTDEHTSQPEIVWGAPQVSVV